MKQRELSILTLIILIVISSCSLPRKNSENNNKSVQIEDDTAVDRENLSEIYSRVMAYTHGGGSYDYCSEGDFFIIPTIDMNKFGNQDWQDIRSEYPKLQQETWNNYLEVNARWDPFPKDLDLGCSYTLADESDASCSLYYRFTHIGFNEDKNQAVVYLTQTTPCYQWSTASLYILDYKSGKWTVTAEILDYIQN